MLKNASSAAAILCVGTTPTVQRTLRFSHLTPGGVNRAREVLVTASGKAVNVARVAARLGARSCLLQILGGDTGRFLARALDAEHVAHESVWASNDAPTRTCTTLLTGDGPTTELVEEAHAVTTDDVAALHDRVLDLLPTADFLCLSGSLAPGVPEDFYATLIEAAHAAGVRALVDTQRAPLRAALSARPFLVKPNREEAAATLGFALTGEAERDAAVAVTRLIEAGASVALVSMGSDGSLLGDNSGERWRLTPPSVEAVNPIGSGDSLAAGLVVALLGGASVADAAAFGTACAAANCLSPTSGVVNPDDAAPLLPHIRLNKI